MNDLSKKFTTIVTTQGMQLLNQAIADQMDLVLSKAVASTNAYPVETLELLNDDNYKGASKVQETTINNVGSHGDGTLAMEIVFDGNDIQYDYTLNTVFIVAEVNGKERLFAVIRANQPQYMNAYDGSSRTNLQINFGFKLDNSEASITINSAAMATTKDIERLKEYVDKQDVQGIRTANENIQIAKEEIKKSLNNESQNLSNEIEIAKNEAIDEANKVSKADNKTLESESRKYINSSIDSEMRARKYTDDNLYRRIDDLSFQNLVYNSEFIPSTDDGTIVEGWKTMSGNGYSVVGSSDERDMWQGSPGLVLRSTVELSRPLYTESYTFKVTNRQQQISTSVWTHVTDNITRDCRIALEVYFFDSSGKGLGVHSAPTSIANVSDGQSRLLYMNDIRIPDNAKTAQIKFSIRGIGNVVFNQPMVTFTSVCLPYRSDNRMFKDFLREAYKNGNSLRKLNSQIESAFYNQRDLPTGWAWAKDSGTRVIRFDNGCYMGFPDDVKPTKENAEYIDLLMDFAKGKVDIHDEKTFKNSSKLDRHAIDFWKPEIVIANPLNNSDDYTWSGSDLIPSLVYPLSLHTDTSGKEVVLQGDNSYQYTLLRILYELGILDYVDLEELGVRRRE